MLEPVPLRTYPPNEEIIRLCRELLRDAKSGRLQAFAVATAVVNIDSLNNMTTENIMKYTRGWKYALFYSLRTFNARLDRELDSLSVNVEPSPLLPEDE